jgi:vacuolar-type H+-ATPase subunit H
LDKNKQLKKKEQVNEFLADVGKNYKKYYEYIIKEKQQQLQAMNMLNDYLNELVKSEQLVDKQLNTAKYDQKQILDEIKKIQEELDTIVSSN